MFERKAENRRRATIYVDEFQTFGYGVHWTTFFAEGRKYDVRLWLITQSIEQIPEQWVTPILNGCTNIFSLAVGSVDAERMTKEFGRSNITEDELLYLPTAPFAQKSNLASPEVFIRAYSFTHQSSRAAMNPIGGT
jgi:hypothetical protein